MKLKGALSNEQALRNMKGVIRQKTLDLLNNFGAVSGAELAAINAETAEYNASTNSGPPADQPAPAPAPPASTWTSATNLTLASSEIFVGAAGTAIVTDGSRWVALGNGNELGFGTKVYYSSNGISWTLSTFNGWTPSVIKRVGGIFFLMGGDGARMRIDKSTDGNTWTNIPGISNIFPDDPSANITDIINDGTNWIVVGKGTGTQAYYTTDSTLDPAQVEWLPWDVGFSPPGDLTGVASIVYGASIYVITGSNSVDTGKNIAYTAGTPGSGTWTAVTAFDNANEYGARILYDAGATPKYIARGNQGRIFTSNDGQSWSFLTPADSSGIFPDAILVGQQWFLVGADGVNNVVKITGLTTSVGYPVFNSESSGLSIAYGNSKLWAVGSVRGAGGENAYYSTDGGSTWTARSVTSFGSFEKVAYGNNRFVAVGSFINSENIQYIT